MKTYSEFEAELTTEQKAASEALFKSVYTDEPPLMCYSDRESDSKHFKKIEIDDEYCNEKLEGGDWSRPINS